MILLMLLTLLGNTHRHLFVEHPVYGWVMQPNYEVIYESNKIKTNSHGFRDSEWREGRKIAVIGDSFVVGLGVEKPFTELLQEKLGYEVMNFGVNGYSPLQELMILKDKVLGYKPEVIVLCVYVRNDFDDLAGVNWLGHFKRPYIKNGIKYKSTNLLEKLKFNFQELPENRHKKRFYFNEMAQVIAEIEREVLGEFVLLIAPSLMQIRGSTRLPNDFLKSLGYSTIEPELIESDYLANQHWSISGHKKVAQLLYDKLK